MAPILVQEVSNDAGQHHTIDLTPVESDLRRLLLDVARFAEENGESAAPASQVKLPDELAREPVVLRFTGGWVRDKLLGVPSHDIDVAINKMTGEQFGLRLKEYLEIPGNPEKYGLVGVAATEQQNQQAMASDKSKMVGGLHKIEANPEKSKHLETITTTLLGLDIDLVNLRKETYTDDSRNPQIEFGTPHEDALRRDATVNAMFYNINTQEIEDLTGRGHADMQARIIRTPLEPYQTFKDDPLRVLRLIRFASRLGYIIEPSALEAMRNVEIKAALQRKISRERVGVELEKALRGPDPHEALRLVFDLGLYYTTFSDPTIPDTVSYMPELEGWATYLDALEALVNNDGALTNVLIRDEEDTYLAWQLAALVPYRNAPQPAPAAPGRRMPPPMASSIAREGIKATNKVCDVVTASVRHAEEISQLVDQVSPRQQHVTRDGVNEEASATRDVLGMALRRWGPTWRSQVLYSYLVELADAAPSGPENITGLRERRYHTTLKLGLTIAAGIERRYTAFVQRLQSLDILEVCSLKPLLDGKALAKALGTAPGPWMKDALDVVMAWQLRNPHLTDTQQAIDAVRQQRGELPAALARHFLELTIRPLFLKNKPSNVTSAGRKKVTPDLPTKITAHALDEDALRPWKSEKERSALDLLRWTTTSLHETMTEQLWPLLVPPILTLIDDRELKYKRMGAERLDEVLNATSPLLLQRTGLGEVFEGALLPCLAFLPPLTSEQETIELLDATYPALLTLVRVRYPLDSPLSSSPIRERIKSLDGLIRKGILHTYDSCTNRPNVLSLCFRHLCPLVRALGIETVKHLRFLIPMIGQTLSNATLIGHVGQHIMLIHAAQALQAVILNAWPRVPEYRGEVMKGLTLCWIGLEGSEAASLRQELRTSFAMLLAALGSSAEESAVFKRECAQLTAVDGHLDGLLSAQ